MSEIPMITGYAVLSVGGLAVIGFLLWLVAKIYIKAADKWITVYKGNQFLYSYAKHKKQFIKWLETMREEQSHE